MTRTTAILFATAFTIASVPALAEWDRIASLQVTNGKTQEFNMENFKGNVIGLTARDGDVMCERVTANFANGEMRPIFKGKLPKGLAVRVDLPPGAVESVAFDCGPAMGGMATIDLAADSGFMGKEKTARK
jgi:hypothetical protein